MTFTPNPTILELWRQLSQQIDVVEGLVARVQAEDYLVFDDLRKGDATPPYEERITPELTEEDYDDAYHFFRSVEGKGFPHTVHPFSDLVHAALRYAKRRWVVKSALSDVPHTVNAGVENMFQHADQEPNDLQQRNLTLPEQYARGLVVIGIDPGRSYDFYFIDNGRGLVTDTGEPIDFSRGLTIHGWNEGIPRSERGGGGMGLWTIACSDEVTLASQGQIWEKTGEEAKFDRILFGRTAISYDITNIPGTMVSGRVYHPKLNR